MNLFVKKISILLLLTFILLFVIIILKERDSIVTSKRYLFESNKSSIECLIIGTSHTFMGINPKLFPFKTINIAENGKPIEVDIEIIEKNINNLPNLKYVIIPIDYFTLYFSGMKERSTAKFYHHWNLKDGMIRSYSSERYHFFTCGYSFYNEILKKQTNDSNSGYNPEVNDFSKSTPSQQKNYCEKKMDSWNQFFIDTSISIYVQKRVQKLVTLLKEKKIHTILVTMPVSEAFSKEYDKNLVRKNSLFIQKLSKESNSLYINLENYYQFKNDSLFNDGDHLNSKGALIATVEIKKRILSRLLK